MQQARRAVTVGPRSQIVDAASNPAARAAQRRAWLAIVPFAIAVALPFAPPAATPLLPPEPGASLLARLFPGIPAAWMLARLGALAIGSLLAATAFPARLPIPVSSLRSEAPIVAPRGLMAALVLALAHLAAAVSVSRLDRTGQALYVLAGFAPAAVLWAANRGSATRRPATRSNGVGWGAIAVLIAIWLALRVPRAWHAPGVADSIDTWINFGWLVSTANDGSNLLTSGPQPGVTNLHLVFLGAPLLGAGRIPPSLGWIQAVQGLGVAASAALLAAIVSRLVNRNAALVATATLLFSPFVLALPYVPTAFGVLCALILWTVWLALRLRASASPAALACLGAMGGVATTIPQMVPFAVLAGLSTLHFLLRGPRLPAIAWFTATASFVALALPGFPTPATFEAMRAAYLAVCGQWAGLEAILLGQQSPYAPPVGELWQAGRPGPFDIVLGTLLAPFATPRTALRLWADVYLDPVGASAIALGIAQCLRALRHDRRAGMLLAVLALSVLPGFTSAYDRASLTRAIGLPLVAAGFAGLGFEAIRRVLLPGRNAARVAGAATALIALSGLVLFDCVNPRLLPLSDLGIALRVLEAGRPVGGAVVLAHGGRDDLDWLHRERIARYAPPVPLPSQRYEGPGSLIVRAGDERPNAEVFFYSPALDLDDGVTRSICARWPGAALYSFSDEAGLSRVFAARPAGAGWQPTWPRERWALLRCGERIPRSEPNASGEVRQD